MRYFSLPQYLHSISRSLFKKRDYILSILFSNPVYSGDIDTVKFLIEKGADYNISDEEGTPVFYAFQYGYLELVKYFIEEKLIDPMMKINEYGCTLFDQAVLSGNLETIIYLIDERDVVYDGNDLLESAVHNGHLNLVQYLVEEKEINPNFSSENGWTPLMVAVERGDIEIIEYIIEKGADIDAKARDGTTALHIASGQHDCEIVEQLIIAGADVNARDGEGNTPLNLAAQDYEFQDKRYQLDVVKCLVNGGANINAKNNDGNTAIDVATEEYVIQYLNSISN